MMRPTNPSRATGALLACLALFFASLAAPAGARQASSSTYSNPLPITMPGDGLVESCADPTIIQGRQPGDSYWYMYCTTDPLNDEDRNAEGNFNFRLIPMLRSTDLVNWTYMGDAFSIRPDWVADDAGLWAPNIEYFNNQYYLYYTAPATDLPGGGSAIGVATSPGPLGPWTDSGAPVIEPHSPDCCPGDRRWVFDPDVIATPDGQYYIYYGSYFGGVSVRRLSADGLGSDPASQQLIALPNRYEGPHAVYHDGYYYLFLSATDCCRGPLTGYSVFAARSPSPTGPFVDREGVALLEGRIGGTPVISMNGNRWVGPGHNAVFRDVSGRYWTVYHAIDRNEPYFEGATGFTKRPVLLDPLDWIGGWPTVRAGRWASDSPQSGPAAQPGERSSYRPKPAIWEEPAELRFAEEFAADTLAGWQWVRPPDPATYGLNDGVLRFDTQAADLFVDSNNASVLTVAAPPGNYIVETRLSLNLPAEGCCFNYVQAGLVIYDDDDNFIKLTHVSIWETRQTEFAKELAPVPPDYPRYGNTVVGPPGEWTYLRIARRNVAGEQHYTAYTSRDGVAWARGGTWTHNLDNPRIGLVAMGGSGFTAGFDYVRVYRLRPAIQPDSREVTENHPPG